MEEKFAACLSDLKQHSALVSPIEFSIWLSELAFQAFWGGTLLLGTPSQFKKSKIEKSYLAELEHFARPHFGAGVKVRVQLLEKAATPPAKKSSKPSPSVTPTTVAEQPAAGSKNLSPTAPVAASVAAIPTAPETKPKPAKEKPRPKTALASPFTPQVVPLLAENTFDRFVVTKENALAHDFAKKVVEKLGVINPLYFYGAVGIGKTHLLQAIANHCRHHLPFYKIHYTSPNEFVGEFSRSVVNKNERQFRAYYRAVDLLLIDDVQFFLGKNKSSIEFFHLFNAIYAPGKQMVFTSDRSPSYLDGMDERLKSRLSASAIVELAPPVEASRKQLISFYTKEFGLSLDAPTTDFLAQHLPPDVRKLVGALRMLFSLQELYQTPITLDYCKKHLKEQLQQKKKKEAFAPQSLLAALANHGKLSLSELQSRRKTRQVAWYRQLAMYLLRRYTPLSAAEVGRFLGGKTSSTIAYAFKRVERELAHNPLLSKTIDAILEQA